MDLVKRWLLGLGLCYGIEEGIRKGCGGASF